MTSSDSKKWPRPRVFASRCLGFEACRWNGVTIPDVVVESLKPYVDYVTACPEKEIGLGIPRIPVRLVREKGKLCMIQLETARDVTDLMEKFSDEHLKSLGELDGFILKDRSPSCGIDQVKVYPGLEKSNILEKNTRTVRR